MTDRAQSFYDSCRAAIQFFDSVQNFHGLDDQTLLWNLMVRSAHAFEVAGRVYGSSGSMTAATFFRLVANPTPAGLLDLWETWRNQRPDLSDAQPNWVPVYFLYCTVTRDRCLRELAERGRKRKDRPVYKSWARLGLSSPENHDPDVHRFLDAMNKSLFRTVKGRLTLTKGSEDRRPHVKDMENIALLGAAQKDSHARTAIVRLLREGGTIKTNTGETIEVPTFPELPDFIMGPPDEVAIPWRFISKEHASNIFSKIAPGLFGILEKALPDAARAAQRREREFWDAKERGGTGGPKAKRKGTAVARAQHIPVFMHTWKRGIPDALQSDQPSPQENVEELQETIQAEKLSERAMQVACKEWPNGRLMLQTLIDTQQVSKAAQAVGMSPKGVKKRLKKLQTLLSKSLS
jgi:hypothetical protein